MLTLKAQRPYHFLLSASAKVLQVIIKESNQMVEHRLAVLEPNVIARNETLCSNYHKISHHKTLRSIQLATQEFRHGRESYMKSYVENVELYCGVSVEGGANADANGVPLHTYCVQAGSCIVHVSTALPESICLNSLTVLKDIQLLETCIEAWQGKFWLHTRVFGRTGPLHQVCTRFARI